MKKFIFIFILILLFLAAFISPLSGCTKSTDGSGFGEIVKSGAAETETTDLTEPAATVQRTLPQSVLATANSWAGTWNLGGNWGTVLLKQDGDVVEGIYESEYGLISGTVSGNEFTGTWVQLGKSISGKLKAVMSEDGTRFDLQWQYDPGQGFDEEIRSDSKAERTGGAEATASLRVPKLSWAGIWDAGDDWGTMTFTQTGNTVVGNSADSNISMIGTVMGDVLSGDWTKNDSAGKFMATMAGNLMGFDMEWQEESGENGEKPEVKHLSEKTRRTFDTNMAVYWEDNANAPDPGPASNQQDDWNAKNVALKNTGEAELMVRVGSINALNSTTNATQDGYNPFTAKNQRSHNFPWKLDPSDPEGTNRIYVGGNWNGGTKDGYSSNYADYKNGGNQGNAFGDGALTITIKYDVSGISIKNALLQLCLDDFQAPSWGSNFTVTLNGINAPFIAELLNHVDQSGPTCYIASFIIPENYFPELASGKLVITIDETTGIGDGYAIDFARLLINYNEAMFRGAFRGRTEPGATVRLLGTSIATTADGNGNFKLNAAPGLNAVRTSKNGFIENYGYGIVLVVGTEWEPYIPLQQGAGTSDIDYSILSDPDNLNNLPPFVTQSPPPGFKAAAASGENYELSWHTGSPGSLGNPVRAVWNGPAGELKVTYIYSGNYFDLDDINEPQASRLYKADANGSLREVGGVTSKIISTDDARSASATYYGAVVIAFYSGDTPYIFEKNAYYAVMFDIIANEYHHSTVKDGNPFVFIGGGVTPANSPATYDVAIAADKTQFAEGEKINVTVSGITAKMVDDSAWIGISKAGAPYGEYDDWVYVKKGTNQYELTAPIESGQYEFRLFHEQEYNEKTVIAAYPFTVISESEAVKMQLSKTGYSPNEPILVTIAGITAKMAAQQAYVSIYVKGAPHDEYGQWQHVKQGANQIKLTAPDERGDYEMRLYRRDGYYLDEDFVTSIPFTVK